MSNANEGSSIIDTQNVLLLMEALEMTMHREGHLPGLVAFSGASGLGKSMAAAHARSEYRAYLVQIKSTWSAKKLLQSILEEMEVKPAKTIYDMADQAAEQLMLSGRPLIIDEADFLVRKSSVEVIRDLHENSGNATIMLIGEEGLEKNLRQWDRVHNRVLKWQKAVPTSIEDAAKFARFYAPGIDIAPDLLKQMLLVSKCVARRVCINIARVRAFAETEGLGKVDLATWGNRELDSYGHSGRG